MKTINISTAAVLAMATASVAAHSETMTERDNALAISMQTVSDSELLAMNLEDEFECMCAPIVNPMIA